MRKFIWNISERQSVLHFKASYFTIGHLSGSFNKIRGQVIAGAQFEEPEVDLIISVSSVETLDAELNRKIRSADILDSLAFPEMSFTSVGGCRASSGVIWELEGDFKIRQISSSINLIVNFSTVKIKGRRTTALFHLFGEVDLKKSGLSVLYNKGIIERLDVSAEIELTKSGEST